jgi:hypothetical protein
MRQELAQFALTVHDRLCTAGLGVVKVRLNLCLYARTVPVQGSDWPKLLLVTALDVYS